MYKEKGCVIVSGDFNSRIGNSLDFIEHDMLSPVLDDLISPVIEYNNDTSMPVRRSQDNVVNSFGRKFLDLCRSTCTRVCNGRIVGDRDGRYTFFNHLGTSVNDFTLVSENYFHVIVYFHVEDFNEWSEYAPLTFHISVNSSQNNMCREISDDTHFVKLGDPRYSISQNQ